MKYVEAPNRPILRPPMIFMAGGITGCPDWQQRVVELLRQQEESMPENLTLLNPRRANFPIDDPSAAMEQISWERAHLVLADAILFWFPKETLCPIVLYELGAWSMREKPIFVGVEDGYARRQDVSIQTLLARPDVEIVWSLPKLVKLVVEWATGLEC